MTKSIFYWVVIPILGLLSCGENNHEKPSSIIFCDISFKPVIKEESKVFNSSYGDKVTLKIYYAPEAECVKAFQEDSVEGLIISRPLNEAEKVYCKNKMEVNPVSILLAYDAISVIVNKQNKDSLLSLNDLKSILTTGKARNKIWDVIMDGSVLTSTAIYLQDSLLQGKAFYNAIKGANTYPEIIDFVGKNRHAIGFLGVTWMGNIDDSQQLTFDKRVTTASLLDAIAHGAYVKPYMVNIGLGRYPLIRKIYFSSKCGNDCWAMDFGRFMINERGQLIFKRSYLFPAQMSFEVKKAVLQN
ncbi:MAG: PstS family phosphate ABC transporter substrate-binding protein [Chitinophagaceae bacterium]